MPADETATHPTSPAQNIATDEYAVAGGNPLAIGDTLTVVSRQIGGAWMVEDESGTVYTATPVE